MELTTITYNGTTLQTAPLGFAAWTAGDITLRLRPNMTWSAARGEHTAIANTAQEAADALTATEAKAERAAKLTARSTKGQIFAREMRTYHHIGARTRRLRKSGDLHAQILECITNATWNAGYYSPARQEAFRAGFGAWMSYDKHIAGYRVDGQLIAHINAMTPWEFCNLLGEMIDAGITNVGQGEEFFNQLPATVYDQAA